MRKIYHRNRKKVREKMTVDNTPENSDNKIRKRRLRLVLNKPDDFHDVRCECGALLYRELNKSVSDGRIIEIKCRRCGRLHCS